MSEEYGYKEFLEIWKEAIRSVDDKKYPELFKLHGRLEEYCKKLETQLAEQQAVV